MSKFQGLIIECDSLIIEFSEGLKISNEQIKLNELLFERFQRVKLQEEMCHFNFSKHITYLNSYLLITMLDLSVNLKNLVKAETDWEKLFFIKNSFLVIYESLEKLNIDNHPFIFENIKKFYPHFIPSCDAFNFKLMAFKNDQEFRLIKKVRNNLSAHIEGKIENYYEIAYSLDAEHCAKIIEKYQSLLMVLFPILGDLTSKISDKTIQIDEEIKKSTL